MTTIPTPIKPWKATKKERANDFAIFAVSLLSSYLIVAVTEMKGKDSSIFTVTADSYEEAELEVPIFSDEDIQLVSQQAGVDEEKAKSALEEAKGDLARAILLLTTG